MAPLLGGLLALALVACSSGSPPAARGPATPSGSGPASSAGTGAAATGSAAAPSGVSGTPGAGPAAWPVSAGDWPTYGRTPDRTGSAPAPATGVHGLQPAWQARLDGAVYGQPLVLDGGRLAVAATLGGSVYGLDVAGGQVRWRVHVADPQPRSGLPCGDVDPLGILSTPAYDPATGLVFALAETSGAHHVLAAVDPAAGRLAWTRSADPVAGDRVATQQRSALLVANGRVYVAYGGLYGDCGGYIGQVLGLPTSGATGPVVSWRVPVAREGGIWSPAGPVLLPGGRLAVAIGNGSSTTAYDGSDSVTLLTPDLAVAGRFTPATWAADNAADRDLGSGSPAVLAGGTLLLQVGKSGTGYLVAVAPAGSAAAAAQAPVCRSFGAPAVAGMRAFVPCQDGVRAVDVTPARLAVAWHAADTGLTGPPVVVGGQLLVSDPAAGALAVLDATTGALVSRASVGPLPHFASPSVTGSTVLVPTLAGMSALRLG